MKPDAKTRDTPEREVFLSALEKAPQDRAAFLDLVCGGDAALRKRVEELLREADEVGHFLETPAMGGVLPRQRGDTALVASITEQPGDRIGRYKLLQKIGEGGCGVVYMAEQEHPVRRRVALKIIKLGMDTKGVIARFEAERQALAMMDHANIARVFDAGATENGRPYFVMELVRGIRMTEYCDQNNLPTEQRLKLFVQVCQAIQHAHQKGIIHRDIKPSNILVTLHDGVPVPKVIDFGIAKATEQRLTDKTLFTEFTAFIGTPAYMSPEQAEMSGLDIDTRSDVYALGVLLYELLTGKTPFDPETLLRAGLDECRRTIREQEPSSPSTRLAEMMSSELTTTANRRRTAPVALVNELRGDLDWIVMKALEKDRTRRYPTANDLAEDVRRYLDNEAVLARPPSNLYRFQKLVRRHRGAFSAAAAVAAALVAGVTISLWQTVRATHAERRARSAQQQEVALRQQAVREQGRAEMEKSAARLNEYIADINLAQQSLKDGNYGRAVQLLEKHRPQPGEADRRGFEWRYLWQVSQGDEHVSLPRQDLPVQSLAISPDGKFAAVGALFPGVEKCNIIDLASGTLVRTLPKGAGSVAFLPDGKGLLTASRGTVRVWDTTDWTERLALRENSTPIALSRDGKFLAASSRDGLVLWGTDDWKQRRVFRRASGPMAFSPDGKSLAMETPLGIAIHALASESNGVLLENSTNVFVRDGRWFRNEQSLAFSPDGSAVVAARNVLSEHGVFVLSIWDAATGKELGQLPASAEHIEHTGVISGLAFSPDGRTLATSSMDHSIRLWNFQERRKLATLQGHVSEAWALAFSADGTKFITGGKDGSLKLWQTHRPVKEDAFAAASTALAFSIDSQRLAALDHEGAVLFLNVRTGEIDQRFPLEHKFDMPRFRFGFSAAVSDDFTKIAQTAEGGVKLWNTETREASMLKASDRRIDWFEMSPNGQDLISGGFEARLRWWDLRAGTNFVMSSENFRPVFSPDGSRLAMFGRSNMVEIWSVPHRALASKINIEPQPGTEHAFSHDGQLLAAACVDDSIRVYKAGTGELAGTFTGHKQRIVAVTFSPDKKTLATASDDSTVKLWNVATQQELLTDRRLGGAVRSLMFSPDGQMLAAGTSRSSGPGGIRLYRAPAPREAGLAAPERSEGGLARR